MISSLCMKKDSKRRFTIRDIAAMGMMLALIEVSKRALEFLPNVELVTLLFMVFTLNFGLEVLAVSVAFTLVETAFWGVNNWVIISQLCSDSASARCVRFLIWQSVGGAWRSRGGWRAYRMISCTASAILPCA